MGWHSVCSVRPGCNSMISMPSTWACLIVWGPAVLTPNLVMLRIFFRTFWLGVSYRCHFLLAEQMLSLTYCLWYCTIGCQVAIDWRSKQVSQLMQCPWHAAKCGCYSYPHGMIWSHQSPINNVSSLCSILWWLAVQQCPKHVILCLVHRCTNWIQLLILNSW